MDDRVVREVGEAEERTAGGIVLRDSAREKPQRGTVVAAGPGKLLDSGSRGEMSASVGDEVLTAGGILGKIVAVSEHYVVVKIGDNTEVKIQKSSVSMVVPKGTYDEA